MALLDQQDMAAAMALMMYWLSNSETVPLTEGDYSFHPLALRWLEQLWEDEEQSAQAAFPRVKHKTNIPQRSAEDKWKLTKKFFDYLEANADYYWTAPKIELDGSLFEDGVSDKEPERPKHGKGKSKKKDEDDVFRAAYENVVYQDSADDGVDDFMLDMPDPTGKYNDGDDDELAAETERISDRLTFIVTMSKLWKFTSEKAALLDAEQVPRQDGVSSAADNFIEYLKQARHYADGLDALLRRAAKYIIPPPRGTADSLMEYDRHRGTKEILMDRIVWTNVELNDAKMLLQALLGKEHWDSKQEPWEKSVLEVIHGIFRNDIDAVQQHWLWTLKVLAKETILYVPTSRGGTPWAIVRCRSVQQAIMRLMEYAPRLGLLVEAFQLLGTVKAMEEGKPVSPGAITEFDRLVETATRAVTKCIAVSSKSWRFGKAERTLTQDAVLIDYMERVVELLLAGWLNHSQQIRISQVETLLDRSNWGTVKQFIQQYGKDIFTQQNMGFGNLRAVLHQGTAVYLQSLMKMKFDNEEPEVAAALLEDIARKRIDISIAASHLELVFEAVAENYSQYIDYNSTTTHSDHGEKLYMLLDMLRVQVGYDRIAWNLKPVYWIHDELIRNGCVPAAMLWEHAVARRSVNAAEEYLRQYNRLSEKYGMWLPSVHEHLQERFVRPLQIDRMCGLVPKAIRQVRTDEPKTAFKELRDIIEIFAKEPLGVGFEMPEWLAALQEEVSATRTDVAEPDDNTDKDIFRSAPHIEQTNVTRQQLDKFLEQIGRRGRFNTQRETPFPARE
jgi:hypothetical protein